MNTLDYLYKKLTDITGPEHVYRDEPMSRHTTFRIGGPADLFVCPQSGEQAAAAAAACEAADVPYVVVGNGSNLLVSDAGWRGVVIQIFKNLEQVTIDSAAHTVTAQAGALLSALAAAARDAGLAGMEFASGIPGTLGGAVTMNAGAYGGEMKDILRTVTVLDRAHQIRTLEAELLELGYRTSRVREEGWIVLGAELVLRPGDRAAITDRIEELREARTSRQPLNFPSAGSTFKRPEGYFAGKLIMDAGLAGASVGDAQISEKHCGFLINRGSATADEVYRLILHVQEEVEARFGVRLEPEVKFLGEFGCAL